MWKSISCPFLWSETMYGSPSNPAFGTLDTCLVSVVPVHTLSCRRWLRVTWRSGERVRLHLCKTVRAPLWCHCDAVKCQALHGTHRWQHVLATHRWQHVLAWLRLEKSPTSSLLSRTCRWTTSTHSLLPLDFSKTLYCWAPVSQPWVNRSCYFGTN